MTVTTRNCGRSGKPPAGAAQGRQCDAMLQSGAGASIGDRSTGRRIGEGMAAEQVDRRVAAFDQRLELRLPLCLAPVLDMAGMGSLELQGNGREPEGGRTQRRTGDLAPGSTVVG